MKRQVIPACVLLILGLTIAIGSQGALGPCIHEDGSVGACHWAGRAMLGVGGLMSALSALALALRRERPGLYLSVALASVTGMLIPGTLIALCKSDTMHCRMVMQPAMWVLCVLALAASVIGWALSRGRASK